MDCLKIEALNVSHGDLQAIWDLNVRVTDREIVSIVGANGAGKTTLMKSVTGIVRSASGKIYFHDIAIQDKAPHAIVELGVVLVPEGRLIFGEMTVLENLEMGSYTSRTKHKRKQSLDYVYTLFPVLSKRRWQEAKTLSGGEQQMLAIGRGMMSLPKLLMLDEMSLGVAPKIAADLFKAIVAINKEGMTILLVEQNVSNALRISHRGYVLQNGRIAMEGLSQDLLQNSFIRSAYLGL
jgi:branched-chain amino acid transport system ATP-binding protein